MNNTFGMMCKIRSSYGAKHLATSIKAGRAVNYPKVIRQCEIYDNFIFRQIRFSNIKHFNIIILKSYSKRRAVSLSRLTNTVKYAAQSTDVAKRVFLKYLSLGISLNSIEYVNWTLIRVVEKWKILFAII